MNQDIFSATYMVEFRQIHGDDYFLPCKLKEEDCNLISTSHGRLGSHQEFLGFPYKQRASQHNSTPHSTPRDSIPSSIFSATPHKPTLGFHSLIPSVFKSSRRRGRRRHHHQPAINFVHHHHHLGSHGLDCLLSRIQGFVVSKFFMLPIWCNSTFSLIILYEFLFVA